MARCALIVSGEMPAGPWPRETTLPARIGVSGTPIREALERLTVDGLVELSRNVDAQLVSFSPADTASLCNA